jgi:hypothetical protein
MHQLAYAYHWSPEVLWLLSNKEREMWYDLLMQQINQEEAAANKEPIPSWDFPDDNDEDIIEALNYNVEQNEEE